MSNFCLAVIIVVIGLACSSQPDASHEEKYRKPCEDGDGAACETLGTFYSNRGDRTGDAADLQRGTALYRRACEDLSNAFGCSALAGHYKVGAGVPVDMERAVFFSRRGCDFGNAFACAFLGDLYRSGNGVPRDEVRALDLYRRGMELNSVTAAGGVRKGGLPRSDDKPGPNADIDKLVSDADAALARDELTLLDCTSKAESDAMLAGPQAYRDASGKIRIVHLRRAGGLAPMAVTGNAYFDSSGILRFVLMTDDGDDYEHRIWFAPNGKRLDERDKGYASAGKTVWPDDQFRAAREIGAGRLVCAPHAPQATAAEATSASASAPPASANSQAADAPRAKPSFDCATAKTWSAKAICGDDTLAASEWDMAAAYMAVKGRVAGDERRRLVADQTRFNAAREHCEHDKMPNTCLAKLLDDRAAALKTSETTKKTAATAPNATPVSPVAPEAPTRNTTPASSPSPPAAAPKRDERCDFVPDKPTVSGVNAARACAFLKQSFDQDPTNACALKNYRVNCPGPDADAALLRFRSQ